MNTLFLKAPQLTAEIMRAHYCEHDLDKILPLFHETLTWIGAGEDQICYDYETIKDIFSPYLCGKGRARLHHHR